MARTKYIVTYNALKSFFQRHETEVAEIEVLPPALSTDGILEDGLCLGIPKQDLVVAFLHARTLFFSRNTESDVCYPDFLTATKILLLSDPEHLTAANYRKQHLLHLQSQSTTTNGNNAADTDLQNALCAELCFLDSIVTSPLHRQSKSPTLWHHRCWLLRTFFSALLHARDAEQGCRVQDFVAAELTVVAKAGERHPKNYYAWQYGRRLIETADLFNNSLSATKTDFQDLLRASSKSVHDWCLRNPSDVSGWSYLLYLLRRLEPGQDVTEEVIDKTLQLAQDFRWHHESLWVFLRTAIAEPCLLSKEKRKAFVQRLEKDYIQGLTITPNDSTTHPETATPKTPVIALEWIRANMSTLAA